MRFIISQLVSHRHLIDCYDRLSFGMDQQSAFHRFIAVINQNSTIEHVSVHFRATLYLSNYRSLGNSLPETNSSDLLNGQQQSSFAESFLVRHIPMRGIPGAELPDGPE
jgi:uncharacterized protein YpiB (UPF0302 family)